MKLKLIQSGGFTGKTRYAEEDLSGQPKQLQEYLDKHIAAFQKDGNPAKKTVSRDTYNYFIEYKGIIMPLDDELFSTAEMSTILTQLKANLHY